MLTNNKAVYGTDGSLKTLKDMGGVSPAPTPEPIVLDGEETLVYDDGVEETLNNYVFSKSRDSLAYDPIFEHGISSNGPQGLGSRITRALNEGSTSPNVILTLFDSHGNFDSMVVSWTTFVTAFKRTADSENQLKLLFILPDNDGVMQMVKVFSAGLVNDEYTVKFSCSSSDIAGHVIYLQIEY